jgi:hypothetical protein
MPCIINYASTIINYAHLFSDDTTFVTKGKNINLLLEEANNSLELA